ncbi:MAG: ferrous iron transport protein [Bacteroidota bacterium]
MNKEISKIAIVGNPNTGKSTVFNWLTGLHQKVANFPGVTVDRKSGVFQVGKRNFEVIDLPGTYSIFPRSEEERVVRDLLLNPKDPDYPDLVVFVADQTQWERNLLLFTQLYDLKIPMILVQTMVDMEAKWEMDQHPIWKDRLIPLIKVNGRNGAGVEELRNAIVEFKNAVELRRPIVEGDLLQMQDAPEQQIENTKRRYQWIKENFPLTKKEAGSKENKVSTLDAILIHPIWGYTIFAGVLFVIFQFIFRFASLPMDAIDGSFVQLSQWAKEQMPAGTFTNLISEGVIPGIGGVVTFVPQIALLFFFLSILEETGYMSRVVFIMDRLVRPFGLNGKSVVPLMSSVACAIPGIMSARTISNGRDRLITILVAPLMSCSARIPVYTLLISLVVPDQLVGGWLDLKGLVLFAMYALGLFAALLMSVVFKWILKTKQQGFMVMEIPTLKPPMMRQVGLTVWEKVRVFVWDAGKVIVALSIILWAMASYGPSDRREQAMAAVVMPNVVSDSTMQAYQAEVNAVALENSYIGILGKSIEPVIQPMGFDWKIGISIITSFAAREVFVGSMATIYSVGDDFEDNTRLLEKMKRDVNPTTGQPTFTLATGMSLMVFYVFAMQCLATFAVVQRETASWKWPIIQVLYMAALAYLGAWLTYICLV